MNSAARHLRGLACRVRALAPRVLSALVLATVLASTSASAQDAKAGAATQTAGAQTATATKPAPKSAGGKRVIKLDALTVEGRIQKPEAFYVLPRSNLSFDDLQKNESFVTKIEKSVEKDPF